MAYTSTPKPKVPRKSSSAKEKGRRREIKGLKRLALEDRHSYVRLRLARDSFQSMAIVYDAAGRSSEEREHRADQVRQAVKDSLEPWMEFIAASCPNGYYDCYGLCLP